MEFLGWDAYHLITSEIVTRDEMSIESNALFIEADNDQFEIGDPAVCFPDPDKQTTRDYKEKTGNYPPCQQPKPKVLIRTPRLRG